MKIIKLTGRSYELEIDGDLYKINRVGTGDRSLMFNFLRPNHKSGDYFIVLQKIDGVWIYRDWEGDILDNDLFEKACVLIDDGVKSGLIPLRVE